MADNKYYGTAIKARVFIGNFIKKLTAAVTEFTATDTLTSTNVQDAIEEVDAKAVANTAAIGTTDISGIGDGTITGALSTTYSNLNAKQNKDWTGIVVPTPTVTDTYTRTYAVDLSAYKEVEVKLMVNSYANFDSRIIALASSDDSASYMCYAVDGNGYKWGATIVVKTTSIVVVTWSNCTNPTTNYIVLSGLIAR